MTEGVQAVLEVPTGAAIRDELHGLVLADLHGPLGGESEEFGTSGRLSATSSGDWRRTGL